MAQFGMFKEHKDVLRENRLLLLDNWNPEPVMQRLYQQNMISNITMESIKAFSTTTYYGVWSEFNIILKQRFESVNFLHDNAYHSFFSLFHSLEKVKKLEERMAGNKKAEK